MIRRGDLDFDRGRSGLDSLVVVYIIKARDDDRLLMGSTISSAVEGGIGWGRNVCVCGSHGVVWSYGRERLSSGSLCEVDGRSERVERVMVERARVERARVLKAVGAKWNSR